MLINNFYKFEIDKFFLHVFEVIPGRLYKTDRHDKIEIIWTYPPPLQIWYILTFRYAIVNKGRSVKGTKYNNAGCAALNTSEETVAVNKPIIKHKHTNYFVTRVTRRVPLVKQELW